jgi:nitroimidazol reductase NimA-like FMN-containing flavoprotein (pyridoxamine 5'-phosphate oxidase superfamily)
VGTPDSGSRVSRRDQIRMSADELAAFLDEQRTVICASNGHDGWPHLMPLWYVMRGDELWAWTYAKSQKVRNLERDPRATLQIEAGESYDQLRGVMFATDVEIIRDADADADADADTEAVATLGAELLTRYADPSTPLEVTDAIRAQAAKRVALRFAVRRTASWDHRKLGGTY